MQALIEGAPAQATQPAVRQLGLHLAQTQAQVAPAPDLGVDIVTDPLVGPDQAVKAQAHTATALTHDARQAQIGLPVEKSHCARPAAISAEVLAAMATAALTGAHLFPVVR